jgi:hypothetical protein
MSREGAHRGGNNAGKLAALSALDAVAGIVTDMRAQ